MNNPLGAELMGGEAEGGERAGGNRRGEGEMSTADCENTGNDTIIHALTTALRPPTSSDGRCSR